MKKKEMNNRSSALSRYISPSAEVMGIDVQCVLCQSGGNENSHEEDWGGGGFTLGGNN